MVLATEDQLEDVMAVFKKNREWFPHVRKYHIIHRIKWEHCIFQDGVVITFGGKRPGKENAGYIGKKTIGTYIAKKGDVILHQIAKDPDVKTNASEILQEFFRYIEADVVLSVRTDNTRATSFYKKNGMKRVGNINWGKDGYMKGDVWFYENPAQGILKFNQS